MRPLISPISVDIQIIGCKELLALQNRFLFLQMPNHFSIRPICFISMTLELKQGYSCLPIECFLGRGAKISVQALFIFSMEPFAFAFCASKLDALSAFTFCCAIFRAMEWTNTKSSKKYVSTQMNLTKLNKITKQILNYIGTHRC